MYQMQSKLCENHMSKSIRFEFHLEGDQLELKSQLSTCADNCHCHISVQYVSNSFFYVAITAIIQFKKTAISGQQNQY